MFPVRNLQGEGAPHFALLVLEVHSEGPVVRYYEFLQFMHSGCVAVAELLVDISNNLLKGMSRPLIMSLSYGLASTIRRSRMVRTAASMSCTIVGKSCGTMQVRDGAQCFGLALQGLGS